MNTRKLLLISSVLILLAIVVLGGYYQFFGNTTELNLDARFEPPGLIHPGGTDELGRNVISRTLQGASLSLWLAMLAWLVSLMIGLAMGSAAGYFPRTPVDIVISGLITYAYTTPFIIFLIALLGLIGPGLANAYLILVLFAWAPPARQTRSIVVGLKDAGFMKAAHSFGYSAREMIAYVIIPQVFKPVLIASLAIMPEIIALDAVLSFFGLGVQPPTPSLGKMIVDGMNFLSTAWWMTLIPVAVLFGICLLIRNIANLIKVGSDGK